MPGPPGLHATLLHDSFLWHTVWHLLLGQARVLDGKQWSRQGRTAGEKWKLGKALGSLATGADTCIANWRVCCLPPALFDWVAADIQRR